MSLYISKVNPCKFIVASLTVSLMVVNADSGLDNGTIITVVSGGNAPYLYSINRAIQQQSNQFSNLAAGSYLVQVVDMFGKIGYASTTIYQNVDCGLYSGSTWDDINSVKWGEFANCIWNDFI